MRVRRFRIVADCLSERTDRLFATTESAQSQASAAVGVRRLWADGSRLIERFDGLAEGLQGSIGTTLVLQAFIPQLNERLAEQKMAQTSWRSKPIALRNAWIA